MKLLRLLIPAALLAVSIAGCTTVVHPGPGYGPGPGPGPGPYGHCWRGYYGGLHCN